MKILFVQDYLRSGGTERHSVLLANAFARSGDEATLLTFRPGGPLAPTVDSKVRRIALQSWDTGMDWYAPGLVRTCAQLDPDVLICHGRMANCYAGRLQEKLPRSAVIATLRTGKPLPRLFRNSLGRVRHVIANSDEARQRAIDRHAIGPDRISVIRNPLVFPADTPASSSETLRHELSAGPGTCVLLSVAMFRPEKGQRELIEIVAGLPTDLDWQLWLAGDGPERPACERLAAERGLSDRIRFPGWLRDPAAHYHAADLAVHASSSESLSNFVIEAQAHGLPAVAYDALGISECMIPGKSGMVIPSGDRDAFRAAIRQLSEVDDATRQQRSELARTFAREAFDPERQVQAYRELFVRLRG